MKEDANNSTGLIQAISNIPFPFLNNTIKACDRLLGSLIDIPIAYLEGIAAEKRSLTKGRENLIIKVAETLSPNGDDNDNNYSNKVFQKYASKLLREQININKIIEPALKEITNYVPTTENPSEISEDWLSEFEEIARMKSSEDIQLIFSKILAGEIMQPDTFSIRTLKVLSTLTTGEANQFKEILKSAFYVNEDWVIIKQILHNNYSSNHLLNLQDAGLIQSNENTNIMFESDDFEDVISFDFGEYELLLYLKTDTLSFPIYKLSKAGRELASLTDIKNDFEDLKTCADYFKKRDVTCKYRKIMTDEFGKNTFGEELDI